MNKLAAIIELFGAARVHDCRKLPDRPSWASRTPPPSSHGTRPVRLTMREEQILMTLEEKGRLSRNVNSKTLYKLEAKGYVVFRRYWRLTLRGAEYLGTHNARDL